MNENTVSDAASAEGDAHIEGFAGALAGSLSKLRGATAKKQHERKSESRESRTTSKGDIRLRLARPLENLIDQLLKLPTIGPKTAQRLALFILKLPENEARQIAQAIIDAREKVSPCSTCGCLTDIDPCAICQDQGRNRRLLCVVEETSDVIAIERTGFRGRYYVLNKNFHLMEGFNLDDLHLQPLIEQLASGDIEEMVLALNPDIDGEVLSRYIADLAKPHNVRVTRLAHGLPVGGDIEFTDEITLRRALEGRSDI
jgi:recombination protein RecR